jgi:hypothetical protein
LAAFVTVVNKPVAVFGLDALGIAGRKEGYCCHQGDEKKVTHHVLK